MVKQPLYIVHEHPGPVLLNFPHSGTYLPDKIAAQLGPIGQALGDTDWHVPELYEFAKGQVSWLEATHSRYVVDLNRDPSGGSLYPGQAGTEICPITDFAGAAIYLPGQAPDTQRRVAAYFDPYHQQLTAQIQRIYDVHGYCILLDCHSIRAQVPRLFDGVLPDLNLGTFNGASCGPVLAQIARKALGNSWFSFVENGRFKGGWITRHYGQPAAGIHGLQLEISQNCYLDPQAVSSFDPAKANSLQASLQGLIYNLNKAVIIDKETTR